MKEISVAKQQKEETTLEEMQSLLTG